MRLLDRAAQLASQISQQNNGQTQISPFMQSGLNALMNRDAKKGEEIANQILQNAGISREQAMQIARQRGLI